MALEEDTAGMLEDALWTLLGREAGTGEVADIPIDELFVQNTIGLYCNQSG